MLWMILVVLIQLMILGTLWGVLMAMKQGFNQVIAGLEAIERGTSRARAPEERGGRP